MSFIFESLFNTIVDYTIGADIIHDYNGVEYHLIPGEEFYYIDEYGDVISMRNGEMHSMSTYCNQHGHKYVDFSFNGKRKCTS